MLPILGGKAPSSTVIKTANNYLIWLNISREMSNPYIHSKSVPKHVLQLNRNHLYSGAPAAQRAAKRSPIPI